MMELMPERKKNEFQKRLIQKNKEILKEEDEMITKANQFKQKNVLDKYPMLETQEGNLFDTIAICTYLASTGKGNLNG